MNKQTRSRAQLNAISRAYRQKNARERRQRLEALGLLELFDNQTIYKTSAGFLRALRARSKKLLIAAAEAKSRANSEYFFAIRRAENKLFDLITFGKIGEDWEY